MESALRALWIESRAVEEKAGGSVALAESFNIGNVNSLI